MKSDNAIFSMTLVVYAIIEELEGEGASLPPLLIEYKEKMKPYYDKAKKGVKK